jgi:hypothetical protein
MVNLEPVARAAGDAAVSVAGSGCGSCPLPLRPVTDADAGLTRGATVAGPFPLAPPAWPPASLRGGVEGVPALGAEADDSHADSGARATGIIRDEGAGTKSSPRVEALGNRLPA